MCVGGVLVFVDFGPGFQQDVAPESTPMAPGVFCSILGVGRDILFLDFCFVLTTKGNKSVFLTRQTGLACLNTC